MISLNCEKCGAAMALAETLCHACGAPAPAGRAAQVLRSKAEASFEQGDLAEAVRQLSRAVDAGLPEAELGLACRKLGLWQEKLYAAEARPELLASAEASYRKAILANDADDIAHQLFIAVSARQGHMGQAAALYQERLSKDPEDAVAKKQLTVVKLTADIKAAPVPKAAARPPATGLGGMLERALKPSTWKVMTLVAGMIGAIITPFMKPSAADVSTLTSGEGVPMSALDVGNILFDPWVAALQVAVILVILYFMYRNRE